MGIDDYLDQLVDEIRDGEVLLRHLKVINEGKRSGRVYADIGALEDDITHLRRVFAVARLRAEAIIANADLAFPGERQATKDARTHARNTAAKYHHDNPQSH